MVKYKNPLDVIFFALSDPTRRMIMYQISLGKLLTASDIARPHHVSQAAISKQVKILEQAGLIRRKKQGKNHLFSLSPLSLKIASDYLSEYRPYGDVNIK